MEVKMSKRKKTTSNSSGGKSFDSLIGSQTYFEGNINCEGSIRIDGKINGDIKAQEDVFISETAFVTGTIHGNNVHICGKVEGNVYSVVLTKLYSPAKLHGFIEAASFVTEEGAYFNGKCEMLDSTGNKISQTSNEIAIEAGV